MTSLTATQVKKIALTNRPLLDAIRHRWSPRAFDSRPVEREKLLTILEAARWAASGNNLQPWRFIIAERENEAEFQAMLSILNEHNQSWAKNAPVLLLAVVSELRPDGNRNGHAEHDTGMAMAHIALQATELGLHTHMMGGFSAEKAREIFAIPEGYRALTTMVIGYNGYLDQLSEQQQAREQAERSRKPLSEIVFSGQFGQAAIEED
jgi:nitroreductase